MNLEDRIQILDRLKSYMLSDETAWQEARQRACYCNSWFLPGFIDLAIKNIAEKYLDRNVLDTVCAKYGIGELAPSGHFPGQPEAGDPIPGSDSYPQSVIRNPQYPDKGPKTVGIVMAGNIPLVGFHDFLCTFVSGHRQQIRLSSKDNVLLPHLVEKMKEWNPVMTDLVSFAENLKGCDAYIATGSNQSGRYFEQYFSKYPHIIRKNRTSVAILDGTEKPEELDLLSNDIQEFFGLGCRNISQIWVPDGYDFMPLLHALMKFEYFMDSHKYKHNYDYALTVNILNKTGYYTNESIVLSPSSSPFSGIANLNYAFYGSREEVLAQLNPDDIQLIVGHGHTPFGGAQSPGFTDYADGVDTMTFLVSLYRAG